MLGFVIKSLARDRVGICFELPDPQVWSGHGTGFVGRRTRRTAGTKSCRCSKLIDNPSLPVVSIMKITNRMDDFQRFGWQTCLVFHGLLVSSLCCLPSIDYASARLLQADADDYDPQSDQWTAWAATSEDATKQVEAWIDYWGSLSEADRAREGFMPGFDRRGLDYRLAERQMYDQFALRVLQRHPTVQQKFLEGLKDGDLPTAMQVKLKRSIERLEPLVSAGLEQLSAARNAAEQSSFAGEQPDPARDKTVPSTGRDSNSPEVQQPPAENRGVVQSKPGESLRVNDWQLVEPEIRFIRGVRWAHWQVSGQDSEFGPEVRGRPVQPDENLLPQWVNVSEDSTGARIVRWADVPEGYRPDDAAAIIDWYYSGGRGDFYYDEAGKAVAFQSPARNAVETAADVLSKMQEFIESEGRRQNNVPRPR